MEPITGITRGGEVWTPKFVDTINQEDCLGCGRCYKACGRDVLIMVGLTEDDEVVDAFDDEAERKVMNIGNANNCIGCEACGRACPKNLYTFAEMPLAAAG